MNVIITTDGVPNNVVITCATPEIISVVGPVPVYVTVQVGLPVFIPGNYDLEDFTNLSVDPFVHQSELGNSELVRTSGEDISSGMAVIIDTDGLVYKYDITNTVHAGLSCGVTKTSGTTGGAITLKLAGSVLTDVGSGWSAGHSYFVGVNSLLTVTPPAVGIVKKIATGIDTDTIIVDNYSEYLLI